MTASPSNPRRAFAAWLVWLVFSLALTVGMVGACSNGQTSCSSPSSGTFSIALAFSQTVDVDIYCGGATGDAAACGGQPHPFDGQTWSVSVNGSSANLSTGSGSAWSCQATSPESSPADEADGGAAPGTGCYLLVTCNQESTADAAALDVQLQIYAQGSNDAIALVHQLGGDCCSDEYTGSWQ